MCGEELSVIYLITACNADFYNLPIVSEISDGGNLMNFELFAGSDLRLIIMFSAFFQKEAPGIFMFLGRINYVSNFSQEVIRTVKSSIL